MSISKRISKYPLISTPLDGTEELLVNKNGVTQKTTVSNIIGIPVNSILTVNGVLPDENGNITVATSSPQGLQSVTDIGFTTSNNIIATGSFKSMGIELDAGYSLLFKNLQVRSVRQQWLEFKLNDTAITKLSATNFVADTIVEFILPSLPTGVYTLATLDDIPTGGGGNLQSVLEAGEFAGNNAPGVFLTEVQLSKSGYLNLLQEDLITNIQKYSQYNTSQAQFGIYNTATDKELICNIIGIKQTSFDNYPEGVNVLNFNFPEKEAGTYEIALKEDTISLSGANMGNNLFLLKGNNNAHIIGRGIFDENNGEFTAGGALVIVKTAISLAAYDATNFAGLSASVGTSTLVRYRNETTQADGQLEIGNGYTSVGYKNTILTLNDGIISVDGTDIYNPTASNEIITKGYVDNIIPYKVLSGRIYYDNFEGINKLVIFENTLGTTPTFTRPNNFQYFLNLGNSFLINKVYCSGSPMNDVNSFYSIGCFDFSAQGEGSPLNLTNIIYIYQRPYPSGGAAPGVHNANCHFEIRVYN